MGTLFFCFSVFVRCSLFQCGDGTGGASRAAAAYSAADSLLLLLLLCVPPETTLCTHIVQPRTQRSVRRTTSDV